VDSIFKNDRIFIKLIPRLDPNMLKKKGSKEDKKDNKKMRFLRFP